MRRAKSIVAASQWIAAAVGGCVVAGCVVAGCVVAGCVVAGCGADDLGVVAIAFELAPAGPISAPEGIDAPALAAATGAVEVDVLTDEGTIHATGLPVPPEGLRYEVELVVASDERAGLGGAAAVAEPAGHTHGALVVEAGGEHTDAREEALEATATLALGELRALSSGAWHRSFASGDLGGRPMGAVRGCHVWLTSDGAGGVRLEVLTGQVGEEAAAPAAADDGHTGHVHGA